MKKIIVAALLGALFFSCLHCATTGIVQQPKERTTPAQMQLARSVARLTSSSGDKGRLISTAFAISPSIQVTAGHSCLAIQQSALENKEEPVVKLEYVNNQDEVVSINSMIIHVDPSRDLCFLYNNKNDMIPLSIGMSKNTPRLTKVFLMGAPLGHWPIMVDCYLASHNSIEELYQYPAIVGSLTLSCVGSPGFSGAPIVNQNGEVIGVLTNASILSPSIPLGTVLFATTSEELLKSLKSFGL